MASDLISHVPITDALARERDLLNHVSAHPTERFLWFWSSDQCLVAPQKFGKFDGFAEAAATLTTAGWPVALRSTGGDVTPQGVGVVNVTHVYATPPRKTFDLDAAYGDLCSPIEAALVQGASRGWQPGAFCDGAHNVQWNGLKFAGTAMRFRPCKGDKSRFAVLAHALMLIEPPGMVAIGALNTFLKMLAEPREIAQDAHTGLPEGMGVQMFLERLQSEFLAAMDSRMLRIT